MPRCHKSTDCHECESSIGWVQSRMCWRRLRREAARRAADRGSAHKSGSGQVIVLVGGALSLLAGLPSPSLLTTSWVHLTPATCLLCTPHHSEIATLRHLRPDVSRRLAWRVLSLWEGAFAVSHSLRQQVASLIDSSQIPPPNTHYTSLHVAPSNSSCTASSATISLYSLLTTQSLASSLSCL